MILAVLAVTSGTEGYELIEEFGKFHYDTLKKRPELPNGIPSHDTISHVFQAIKFRQSLMRKFSLNFSSATKARAASSPSV